MCRAEPGCSRGEGGRRREVCKGNRDLLGWMVTPLGRVGAAAAAPAAGRKPLHLETSVTGTGVLAVLCNLLQGWGLRGSCSSGPGANQGWVSQGSKYWMVSRETPGLE